jgi:tripartite-type tricarboxylate transporter receptor subunit TctC
MKWRLTLVLAVLTFVLAGMALLVLRDPARGEAYPARPIRLVVAALPGAPSDAAGRALAAKMSEILGQPIVVENRGGASGVIAVDAVAKSAPDGYTIGIAASGSMAIAPSLTQLPYDPEKDIAPITRVSNYEEVLVARAELGVRSLPELIAKAKQTPGQITLATAGSASMPRLAAEVLEREAGIDLVNVPYRGGPAALNDLLGGHVDTMLGSAPVLLPHIVSGKLVAIALPSEARSVQAELADVPTTAELGFPNVLANAWNVLIAAGGTPPAIIARLSAAAVEALRSPDVESQFRRQGATPVSSTPEECAAFIRSESTKWGSLAVAVGLKWD